MTPNRTLHLRFVVRNVIDPEASNHEYSAHRPVRILQQFWEDQYGEDVTGDMFNMVRGTWRDVPEFKE